MQVYMQGNDCLHATPVPVLILLFSHFRRVIIRENPKDVSEYIADYIISMCCVVL